MVSDQSAGGNSERRTGAIGEEGPGRRGVDQKGARDHPGRASAERAIGLAQYEGENYELVHPRGVTETELDYEEGIELWKAGDPESARDALRYALRPVMTTFGSTWLWGGSPLTNFVILHWRAGISAMRSSWRSRALPQGFAGRLPRDRPEQSAFLRSHRRVGSEPGGPGPA